MLLEVKHLAYETDQRTIFNNINFKLDQGETAAMVGPSGSGKSTFLRQLNNLISPTEGELLFKGRLYDEYSPEELRSKTSYMMQQSELFGMTVENNMAPPALTYYNQFDEDKANNLLDKADLSNYSLDSKVEHMSGGERRRIAIARQLMYQPEILLLDESTSAFDMQNKEKIGDIIFKLVNEGVVILWTTHSNDQSTRNFQRRVTIKDGRITNEKVSSHNEQYSALFNSIIIINSYRYFI